jgi:hypothetical protein
VNIREINDDEEEVKFEGFSFGLYLTAGWNNEFGSIVQ